MGEQFDFGGWATKNDLKCTDGRTIRKDAFIDDDGKKVPLCWMHQHGGISNVLGHAVLENRENGVYAHCKLNDTPAGQHARISLENGDIESLSIYANQLKEMGGNVMHGVIREVSLVLAGANPGARIDTVMIHSDGESEAEICMMEPIDISHSDEDIEHAATEEPKKEEPKDNEEKTVKDVFDSMTEEQKNVCYAMIGVALEEAKDDDKSEGGEKEMKHNAFEQGINTNTNVISHADQEAILALAKSTGVGSLKDAMRIYAEQSGSDELKHSIDADDIEYLFPDYKNLDNGEPETLTRDMTWVDSVIAGVHKSPVSRIRTRQIDAKQSGIRAKGYVKGDEKAEMGNAVLLKRTTDPQTVYVKDSLHRDDIIDITDFSIVDYEWKLMKMALNEEMAIAIMVGDGRNPDADDKISEDHIRSVWHDNELYTIHQDVDIDSARNSLQGTGTAVSFGDNYVYAEAIIQSCLYAREKYKGSGSLTFFCEPHLLNVMLLARDMNGRRIYDSKADLAAALDIKDIKTAEQFSNLTRTVTVDNVVRTKKLLGIFINLSDYQLGSTKGGEISKFSQFDIDFNKEKFLLETRISGALVRVKSAICLEEDITEEDDDDDKDPDVQG